MCKEILKMSVKTREEEPQISLPLVNGNSYLEATIDKQSDQQPNPIWAAANLKLSMSLMVSLFFFFIYFITVTNWTLYPAVIDLVLGWNYPTTVDDKYAT